MQRFEGISNEFKSIVFLGIDRTKFSSTSIIQNKHSILRFTFSFIHLCNFVQLKKANSAGEFSVLNSGVSVLNRGTSVVVDVVVRYLSRGSQSFPYCDRICFLFKLWPFTSKFCSEMTTTNSNIAALFTILMLFTWSNQMEIISLLSCLVQASELEWFDEWNLNRNRFFFVRKTGLLCNSCCDRLL